MPLERAVERLRGQAAGVLAVPVAQKEQQLAVPVQRAVERLRGQAAGVLSVRVVQMVSVLVEQPAAVSPVAQAARRAPLVEKQRVQQEPRLYRPVLRGLRLPARFWPVKVRRCLHPRVLGRLPRWSCPDRCLW